MQEGGEEVRVVYLYGELDEDVLISEVGLLKARRQVSYGQKVTSAMSLTSRW